MATCRVIGQESAEAIVGMEAAILDGMVVGNEPGE
jgi:carbonic anhydrase/acetyltransferase-like protein (isoleucine patch superfamily)